MMEMMRKDTVDDTASLDVATLREVKLDELPKSTGVVIVNSLGITKGFHYWTAEGGKKHLLYVNTEDASIGVNLTLVTEELGKIIAFPWSQFLYSDNT